ncbi:MAG TPA: PadR family transcriptional regulator [Terracidiphilus sp.]|nr:PadR family transcriptional regulator [Terracidiphilus sp.]
MCEQFKEMRGAGMHGGCGQREFRHRRGFGWWGEPPERGSWEGFGGGRGRFFDAGQLRLVILQLIAEKPSYGYEIIKAIEERLSGGYAPSPGVIYPTLTLLEEEGLATVTSTEGGKKMYAATEEGKAYLKANQVALKAILGRMQEAGRVFGRRRSPQVMRAIMNFRLALRMRLERGNLTQEQLSKIAEAIDAAARAIDEA